MFAQGLGDSLTTEIVKRVRETGRFLGAAKVVKTVGCLSFEPKLPTSFATQDGSDSRLNRGDIPSVDAQRTSRHALACSFDGNKPVPCAG